MKILFLTEFFPEKLGGKITGGSESRTYYLCQEFAKLGHDVTVITAWLEDTTKIESWGKVKVLRVGPKRSYAKGGDIIKRFAYMLATVKEGLLLDFDVVDGNNTATYLAVFLLSKLKRKKGVYWIPDALGLSRWINAIGLISGTVNSINEWLSISLPVDKIIALSQTTRDILIHSFGAKSTKISVVYPGIPHLGVHRRQKTFTVVCVNRLAPYKRVDLVIKAVATLGVKLKVIGSGQSLPDLKKLAKELKADVSFFGNLESPRVLEELISADLFCLASENEGFGIATLEAMGFGLPFVNSDIPVHLEIQKASQAGLLFRSGDVNDLTDKMGQLLKNKSLYQRLSNNATRFAKQHTWQKVAGQTEAAYKALLNK